MSESKNNTIPLNEEEKQTKKSESEIKKNLRNLQKINYSQFFSDEVDNSEDFDLSEEIHHETPFPRKRRRNTTEKKPKSEIKASTKKNTENPENQNDNASNNNDEKSKNETIINISEILSEENLKKNNNNLLNSDLILIIFEICLNSDQFGVNKDNSSRAFWEEIGKKPELKPIIDKFKPETLRKYWRTIRAAKKYKKIIQSVKEYKDKLNSPYMKLLSSINTICDYVLAPRRGIDYYVKKYAMKPASKTKKINVNEMPPQDIIKDIINVFKSCFPKKSKNDIEEALYQNSFDIENAYCVLRDKDNLGFLSFSEKEDSLLEKIVEKKENDSNEEYKEMVNTKGEDLIQRRKIFLFDIVPEEENNENNENNQNNENEGENKEKKEEEKKEEDKKEEKEEKNEDKENIEMKENEEKKE